VSAVFAGEEAALEAGDSAADEVDAAGASAEGLVDPDVLAPIELGAAINDDASSEGIAFTLLSDSGTPALELGADPVDGLFDPVFPVPPIELSIGTAAVWEPDETTDPSGVPDEGSLGIDAFGCVLGTVDADPIEGFLL